MREVQSQITRDMLGGHVVLSRVISNLDCGLNTDHQYAYLNLYKTIVDHE